MECFEIVRVLLSTPAKYRAVNSADPVSTQHCASLSQDLYEMGGISFAFCCAIMTRLSSDVSA